VKAVVLLELGKVDAVNDCEEPACGPDKVIVEMSGVGLCGTERVAAPAEYAHVLGPGRVRGR
jgi:threonine dehydrogenase-like Zn-dependent dehydrogenase